eukprot:9809433-Prorocentrum_lima.AAC.1
MGSKDMESLLLQGFGMPLPRRQSRDLLSDLRLRGLGLHVLGGRPLSVTAGLLLGPLLLLVPVLLLHDIYLRLQWWSVVIDFL